MAELIADEENFVDLPRSCLWLAKEHVIVNRLDAYSARTDIKMTWLGAGLPELTPQQFQDHYLHEHAPLVGGYAEILGIYSYIQVHTMDDPLNDMLREGRGAAPPFYVHAEFVWDFAEMADPAHMFEALTAMWEISLDQQEFIDFSASAIWIAQEKTIFPLELH